ncbi:MAG: hypothetical protein HYS13_15700 [Planctomycetia bacterium]|nr:hypothetical protein [Planctomycetia bacterium]
MSSLFPSSLFERQPQPRREPAETTPEETSGFPPDAADAPLAEPRASEGEEDEADDAEEIILPETERELTDDDWDDEDFDDEFDDDFEEELDEEMERELAERFGGGDTDVMEGREGDIDEEFDDDVAKKGKEEKPKSDDDK